MDEWVELIEAENFCAVKQGGVERYVWKGQDKVEEGLKWSANLSMCVL